MKTIPITFNSGKLLLEGIMEIPDGDAPFPAVVVCHPHPLYGGDMDNNVVIAITSALVKSSIAGFRFNFRGAGGSQGKHSGGKGEREDAAAAISFLAGREEVDVRKIGFAGYSAGAAFGLPVACGDARIKALAAVSPPFVMSDFSFLARCAKPRFFITGSEDDYSPVGDFSRLCRSLPPPVESLIIGDADHFWQGYEPEMAEKVAAFFSRELR